jgi:hypothetical protein
MGPKWFIQWILPSVSKSSTLRSSRKTEDSAECVLDDPWWKALSAVADLGHRRWLQLKVTAHKSGQCRLIACEKSSKPVRSLSERCASTHIPNCCARYPFQSFVTTLHRPRGQYNFRRIKRLVRPGLGFKSMSTARQIMCGYEIFAIQNPSVRTDLLFVVP